MKKKIAKTFDVADARKTKESLLKIFDSIPCVPYLIEVQNSLDEVYKYIYVKNDSAYVSGWLDVFDVKSEQIDDVRFVSTDALIDILSKAIDAGTVMNIEYDVPSISNLTRLKQLQRYAAKGREFKVVIDVTVDKEDEKYLNSEYDEGYDLFNVALNDKVLFRYQSGKEAQDDIELILRILDQVFPSFETDVLMSESSSNEGILKRMSWLDTIRSRLDLFLLMKMKLE